MTQDDIIRMAHEVGAARLHSTGNIIFGVNNDVTKALGNSLIKEKSNDNFTFKSNPSPFNSGLLVNVDVKLLIALTNSSPSPSIEFNWSKLSNI